MIAKLIKLTGELQEIDFDPDGKNPYFYTKEGYVWIRNLSPANILFASLSEISRSDIETDEIYNKEIMLILPDEVRLIKLDQRNKFFLMGEDGDAEIYASDSKECPILKAR